MILELDEVRLTMEGVSIIKEMYNYHAFFFKFSSHTREVKAQPTIFERFIKKIRALNTLLFGLVC